MPHIKMSNFKTVEVVYTPKFYSDYVDRLNNFLNPYNDPSITTAMWNKQIKPAGKESPYYRTMICFDYNPRDSIQKCFSYSSPKAADKQNNLIYYILPNGQKINLNAPILIPTEEITVLNHDLAISQTTDNDIKR